MTDERANVLPSACFQDMGELSCGDLVMAILKALRPLQPGDVMEVRALDPAAPIDIPAWCRLTGHTLVAGPCGPDKTHYFIQKKEDA
jgi:tRNA 2-thiouridine synthesizing protein A